MYRELQFYLTQGLGITLQVFWRQGDNPPSVMDLQIKVTCKIAEQIVRCGVRDVQFTSIQDKSHLNVI
jgi:hypothetical protein